jgi:hypothetical protein
MAAPPRLDGLRAVTTCFGDRTARPAARRSHASPPKTYEVQGDLLAASPVREGRIDACEEDVGGSVLGLWLCHGEDGGEPVRLEGREALVFAESWESAGSGCAAVVERAGDVCLVPCLSAVVGVGKPNVGRELGVGWLVVAHVIPGDADAVRRVDGDGGLEGEGVLRGIDCARTGVCQVRPSLVERLAADGFWSQAMYVAPPGPTAALKNPSSWLGRGSPLWGSAAGAASRSSARLPVYLEVGRRCGGRGRRRWWSSRRRCRCIVTVPEGEMPV